MPKTIILNPTTGAIAVPIENPETGETDEVMSQPGGRPDLMMGWRVNSEWLRQHPEIKVRTLADETGPVEENTFE